ncbi:MAG: hypothetical protein OEY85_00070 [Rhodospirillales bacterium]|nr:hypothetical protein [Rhodospirillales bacterium]
MIRMLLTYVLPIILPAAIYILWVKAAQKRKAQAGGGGEEDEHGPSINKGPLFWLILLGVVLAASGLVYMALTGKQDPGGTYQSPRYEGGKIIPGHIK